MTRDEADNLLALLIADELDEPTKADLLVHLETDADLRDKLGDMRVAYQLIQQLAAAGVADHSSDTSGGRLRFSDARRQFLLARLHPASNSLRFSVFHTTPSNLRYLAAAAVLVVAVSLIGIALPTVGAARRTSRQMQSSTQLRGIHQGLFIEAQQHGGEYPKDLGVLVEKGYVSPQYLLSPQDNKQVPAHFDQLSAEAKREWARKESSYAFIAPGEKEATDSTKIVGFEKFGDAKKGVSVVFDDNSVQYLPVDEARKLIERQTGLSVEAATAMSERGLTMADARDTRTFGESKWLEAEPSTGQVRYVDQELSASRSARTRERPVDSDTADPASRLGQLEAMNRADSPSFEKREGAAGSGKFFDHSSRESGRMPRLSDADFMPSKPSGASTYSVDGLVGTDELDTRHVNTSSPGFERFKKLERSAVPPPVSAPDSDQMPLGGQKLAAEGARGDDGWRAEDTVGMALSQSQTEVEGKLKDNKPTDLGGDISGPSVAGVAPEKLRVSLEESELVATAQGKGGSVVSSREVRAAPHFHNAPQFDLNEALSNTSLGGGGGGNNLFGDTGGQPGEEATHAEVIEQLVSTIQDTVGKPDQWASLGGDVSSIRELNGNLIIKTTPAQHREINTLLARLRGRPEPAPVPMSEVDRRVIQCLREPVPVNFDGTKLGDALNHLRHTTGVNFFINWPVLEVAGIDKDTPISLQLTNVPAEQVLRLVLQQASTVNEFEPATYSILEGIVTVSTNRAMAKDTESRVYDVRDLLQAGITSAQIVQAQEVQAPAQSDDPIGRFMEILGEAQSQLSDSGDLEFADGRIVEARQHLKKHQAALKPEAYEELLAMAGAVEQRVASTRQRKLDKETAANPPPPPLIPVNPWTLTEQDAQSTFAIDVDTASYGIARRYIQQGFLPPLHTVRMEEFVNAFDYNYPTGCDEARMFNVYAEAAPAPFAPAGQNVVLLKLGVRGKVIGRDQLKPANLTFVIDTSGSMDRPDRLPLVKRSLQLLLDQLAPVDRVSIVTYGTQPSLVAEAMPAGDRDAILRTLDALQCAGSTNLASGVEVGYQIAARHFTSGAVNRVVLCSDGVANVGPAQAQEMLDRVANFRGQGIGMTSVGFGAGTYDDRMLEQLANKGDGRYLYVGSDRDAQQVFVEDMAATLPTIARNVKIQVEFDPQAVRRYRLIGYENRDVADVDFRNDAVKGGEVGSGKSATALYELELTDAGDDWGRVFVRYEDGQSEKVEEVNQPLGRNILRRRTAQDSPRFYLAAAAAEFAEVLRESEHVQGGNLPGVSSVLQQVCNVLPLDQRAAELLELVRKAEGLPRASQ